jgi:hypothetical protein
MAKQSAECRVKSEKWKVENQNREARRTIMLAASAILHFSLFTFSLPCQFPIPTNSARTTMAASKAAASTPQAMSTRLGMSCFMEINAKGWTRKCGSRNDE